MISVCNLHSAAVSKLFGSQNITEQSLDFVVLHHTGLSQESELMEVGGFFAGWGGGGSESGTWRTPPREAWDGSPGPPWEVWHGRRGPWWEPGGAAYADFGRWRLAEATGPEKLYNANIFMNCNAFHCVMWINNNKIQQKDQMKGT